MCTCLNFCESFVYVIEHLCTSLYLFVRFCTFLYHLVTFCTFLYLLAPFITFCYLLLPFCTLLYAFVPYDTIWYNLWLVYTFLYLFVFNCTFCVFCIFYFSFFSLLIPSNIIIIISGHSMSDCGRKSRCIQRYNFQHLLAVDPGNLHSCPTIRAFKFPSSCVCHIDYPNHHEDYYWTHCFDE